MPLSHHDIETIRTDFPILQQRFNDKPLIYLDNAATSQKPLSVIDSMSDFMKCHNGTVRRGIYKLSYYATEAYEKARHTVQSFISAKYPHEIIFTKGCTEALNLISHSWGEQNLQEGDEILISTMEHHANIVPWQIICQKNNVTIKPIPLTESGEIDINKYYELISPKTKLIAVTHVSNVLGTINPIKELIQYAKSKGITTVIDGCQATPHTQIDVQELDCDFYAFSSHKLYGPTGIGVLYGKESILRDMPPYQAGGDMIDTVSFTETTYADLPNKFEAGTPPIIESVGLTTAIEYIQQIGLDDISQYEEQLLQYATETLQQIPGLKIFGSATHKASLISFAIESIHPYDLSTLLDEQANISIRTGHHCAQPLMEWLGVSSTARVSFAFYNTFEEIDTLKDEITQAIKILR